MSQGVPQGVPLAGGREGWLPLAPLLLAPTRVGISAEASWGLPLKSAQIDLRRPWRAGYEAMHASIGHEKGW